MYAFWRKSDAFNPEIFAEGAVATLQEYDLSIVDLVTDPRTGLPSRLQFPPTVKEIRDACNEIMETRQRRQDRQASVQQQFAAREEYERELAARAKHPTKKQLEKKLGRTIGGDKPLRPMAPENLWARWIEHRMMGTKLSAEARAILEAAGYDINGPEEQSPCRATPPEATNQPSA